MKTKFTLLVVLMGLAGIVSAQDKKPKTKKQVSPKDSVHSFSIVPNSGSSNPLVLKMPVDSVQAGNVKMPNSYRKGLIEPVPMPSHRVELVKPKRAADSTSRNYVEPVPMPNHSVEQLKPKKKKGG